jgi:DNA-binding transcriptional LysR family regulator
MDPRRLLTFRAVAHHKSFSRAAEQLSLTQPSVSHQIALLETEVGIRLIDRGRGELRLTAAGAVLLEHADEVAWRLELADKQIAALSSKHREHLRLGAFPTALAGFVPAAVAALRDTDDDLRVLLSEVTPATLRPRFLRGDFDVALSYQDASTERHEIRGAQRIDLLEDAFLVGLPNEHPLAGEPGPISLKQLADDNWIFASADGFLVQACREVGFDPHIVATTTEPLATRGLIARGLGVGWVPRLLADDYTGITIRPVKERIRHREIYALLPPGERHPRAQQLIDALVQAAADFAPGRRLRKRERGPAVGSAC